MLQFTATPPDCILSGAPADTYVEVRFQNLSNGLSAVRVAESNSDGSASFEFPFSRDHSVHVRILNNDPTIYRLVYAAEQPANGLLLVEPGEVAPPKPPAPAPAPAAYTFTSITPAAGDNEDLI